MKVKVLILVVFLSIFSCRAAKERKQCLEYIGSNLSLNINSFEELKTYTKGVINFDEVLWVKDGLISSKEEVLKLIKNKNILSIDNIKGANGRQLDGKGNGVIIMTTNQCLERIK